MWPWGHLAVGYLAYSFLSRRRFDHPPQLGAAVAVAFGTQFPDLIDKPLAWTVSILPSGRSFAHSMFFAAFVLFALVALGRRFQRPKLAVAFGLGHLSHLAMDAVYPLWVGDYASLAYFVWPLLPVYDSPTPGIIWYILHLEWTPFVTVQFGLTAVAATVWVLDGMPGLALVRRALPRASPDVK